jgi:hypothetical protein
MGFRGDNFIWHRSQFARLHVREKS